MKPVVFIDGSEGTTGLRIADRFSERDDIELIKISEDKRKDPEEISKFINESDITFLCLPDAASKEAVGLVKNEKTRILDTSTAHRTNEAWAYGLPELSKEHEERIVSGKRIAVPGCHATGFISLVYPLVASGLLKKDASLSATSISGYSGGGKKAIAQYEEHKDDPLFIAPRQYALAQQHKHLVEMKAVTGIANAPLFMPFICSFYSGMEVSVPLSSDMFTGKMSLEGILSVYEKTYGGKEFYKVHGPESELVAGNFLSAALMSGRDSIEILVYGNEERAVVTALFDNLGKGASGAAIECMNLMLGFAPSKGLTL